LLNKEVFSPCRVFISHSSKDGDFCIRLAEDLRRELGDNAVWYDHLKLRSGDSWWRIIVNELALCDPFILIISPDSMTSTWVQREHDIAFHEKKRIIPLLYREADNIWPDLKNIHYLSFTDLDRYTDTFQKLLHDLVPAKAPNPYTVAEEEDLKKKLATISANVAAHNWKQLISDVEELKQLRPESVTSLIYYWQGKALRALGRASDAIDALEKAHAMEGDEKQRLEILKELIPVLASLNQWVAVEKSSAMALKISPEEPVFLSLRRTALLAILASTNDKEQPLMLLYDLCDTLAGLGRWNDVLECTKEALQEVPQNQQLLMHRRDALLAITNNRQWHLKILSELCSVLASLEQWNDVLVYTDEGLRRVPDDLHFLTLQREALEKLLLAANGPEESLTLLRKLCSILATLSQWEEMLAVNEKALLLASGDFHLLTQRRDVLVRLLPAPHEQAYRAILYKLCSVLATLRQWEEVLHYTTTVPRSASKDHEISKLQNQARIHLGAFKVSAAYTLFSDWMGDRAADWERFVQSLLGSLQHLIGHKRMIAVLSIFLVLVLSGSALFVVLRPPSSMVIKIGILLPGSGDSQDNGVPIEKAVDLAISNANIMGYKLEPDFKDEVPSGGVSPDPATAENNMQNFSNDAQVAGVIGPYESSIAEKIMPDANKAPLALISLSNTYACLTTTGGTENCPGKNNLLHTVRPTGKVTYFRLATTDAYQGPALANYLKNLKSMPTTAYVIDDGEVYGSGLATSFMSEWKKLHGTVLSYIHDSNPKDYQSLIKSMLKHPPDVVFFAGRTDLGAENFYVQMQLHPTALRHTIYAGGSGLVSPTGFLPTVNTATIPIYASFPFVDVDNLPVGANFKVTFDQIEGASNYGKYTAPGYDSANILIQAIKTAIHEGFHPPENTSDASGAKKFRQAVINAIQNISYNGITGPISFDANGDATNKTFTIYDVANVDGQLTWNCLEQFNAPSACPSGQ
jgi:branched-chain amino acid transport system substrate-binding protein